MNRLVFLIFLVAVSLIWTQSFASAEIKVNPPANWQPSPSNNSTVMVWFQNSTKSVFGIIKPQINTTSTFFPLFRVLLPLILPNANSFIAQMLADRGLLESTDQTAFGKSNYGYRYFVNLNLSSLSKVLNSSDTLLNNSARAIPGMASDTLLNNSAIPGMLSSGSDVPFKSAIPDISTGALVNNSAIPWLLSSGSSVPFKGMFILAMKQGDFYGIFFLSPRANFASVMKEIQPTINSIQLGNSTFG